MRRIGAWLAAIGLTVASVNCGPASTSTGSCSTPATGSVTQCIDYGIGYTASEAMQICSSGSGNYSASACPIDHRVARCIVTVVAGGANTGYTLNFYSPNTAAGEMTSCNSMNTSAVTTMFLAN